MDLERMCATCFTALNTYTNFLGQVSWIHPLLPDGEEYDHEPVPVPKDERFCGHCDFCSAEGSFTIFRTMKGPVMMAIPGGGLHNFGTDWAACERCAPLVRNRSRHLLIDRATAVMPTRNGRQLPRPEQRIRRNYVKKIHMKFFEAEPREIRD